MLELNAGFKNQTRLKNPNRIVLCKLWYDTEADYTAVATRTTRIDGVQYLGIITRFSSPKSTWNWDAQNNVVITTPTLELGNLESLVDNSSTLNNFQTNNYLGRKVEIFMGYQNSTTADDLQQIYSGRIEDVVFTGGKISVLFKANDLPLNELAGALIDIENNTTYSGLPSDVNGLRLPVVYGRVWNAPGVCIQYELPNTNAMSKKYLFADNSKYYGYTSIGASMPSQDRKFTARSESMVYLDNNDYLVPISSYNIQTDGGRVWEATSNASGLVVTFDNDNEQISGDAIAAAVPLRISENNTISSGILSVTGTYADIQDGSTSTYMQIYAENVVGDRRLAIKDTGSIIPYNLRYANDGNGSYAFVKDRKVHVGDKGGADVTYIYGKVGIYQASHGLPSTRFRMALESVIYNKDGNTVLGGTGPVMVDHYPFGSDIGTYWWTPSTSLQTWEMPCGVAAGSWASEFQISGLIEVAYTASLNSGAVEIYDATMSLRESLDNFKLQLGANFTNQPDAGYWSRWRLYELFLLHSCPIDLPKDYAYAEVMGPYLTSGSTFYAVGSGTSVPLKRPYEYIEAMLRSFGYGNSDFVTQDFTDIKEIWGDSYWDRRDYSGFSIQESTKFNDFIKEYLQNELFTLYRDELGKFRLKALRDSYNVTNLNDTIDYNACTRFEMSLSKLKNVVTDVTNVTVDYNYHSREFTHTSNWAIAESGGYSYGFYDYTNTPEVGAFKQEGLSNRYTSHGRHLAVLHSGVSYTVRKEHTASATNAPGNTEFYTSTNLFAKDPAWTSGKTYVPESAESYFIASRWLNQFGNRHRIIKLTSSDPEFYKYQIGDIVAFENVPTTLIGMEISGFAGSTATSATINGQTVYPYFSVYAVSKDAEKVELECFQLHKLDDLTIVRGTA